MTYAASSFNYGNARIFYDSLDEPGASARKDYVYFSDCVKNLLNVVVTFTVRLDECDCVRNAVLRFGKRILYNRNNRPV